jgi:hypothetical protein
MLWRLIVFRRSGKNSKREKKANVAMKRRYIEKRMGRIVRHPMAIVWWGSALKVTLVSARRSIYLGSPR